MDFLNEAFRSLRQLNEETFDITVSDDHDEIKDFLETDDAIDTITIIDDEAEDKDEIKDSYVGKVILDCNICHSLIYKDPADIVIDDEEENANIDEECPYCYSTGDGFKIIGQVKPFVKEEEKETEEESEEEIEDESEEETEGESENKVEINDEEKDNLDELFDLNAQGQTIGVGLGGGTGIAGGVPGGLKIPGISEGCEEKSLKEEFNKVEIETDENKMTMTQDESGKITVITEPIEEEEVVETETTEVIAPIDIETELDIEDNSKEEEPVEEMIPEEESEEEITRAEEDQKEEQIEDEIEIDEFDETSFDELGESYLKKVYGNVESFKSTRVSEDGNKLFIEGLIKFNSNKEKKTNFVFENIGITKDNKVMFEGFNEQIARSKKSFKLNGSVVDNKVVCESLSYRYNQNKNRVNGTVKR